MMHGRDIKVLFYVQHLLGLGHLMRACRIATALHANGFQVTLVTGGVIDDGFEVPGVTHVRLPSIAVRGSDFSVMVNSDNKPIDDHFRARRCQQLLEVYTSVQPDAVVLEAFPFGRRQMRFELLPLIALVEATSPVRPVLVTSVRDVVQRRTKPGRDEQTVALIKQHFDKVLVHGDPQATALDDSFSRTAEIADQIIYTGLVSAPIATADVQRFDIVVSAGGGAVGFDLIRAALGAAALLPQINSWCVITGPNMPADQFEELLSMAPDNIVLERFREDFTGILQLAGLSISQAGYNTVNDVLQAGCRSILVPYSAHGETEQTDRATRMGVLGRASVLDEQSLSAQRLAAVILKVLATETPVNSTTQMNGAERTAEILRELVDLKSQVTTN